MADSNVEVGDHRIVAQAYEADSLYWVLVGMRLEAREALAKVLVIPFGRCAEL